MLWQILLLVASLLVLVVAADWLVRSASSLARRTGLSPFFVGVTIVGFGTSTPELGASVLAALGDYDDIAVGNVVGSNIFNLAVILGMTACVGPVVVRSRAVRSEVWVVAVVACVPFAALGSGGELGRAAGAAMLAAFALYVFRAYRAGKAAASESEAVLPASPAPAPDRGITADVLLILGSVAALVGGSQLLVVSASRIATGLGMSELAIGLTIVAAGTSAPELFTSLLAAKRGNTDVAVGNVFGSNVFNMLAVLGTSCLLEPQVVKSQVIALDTPVMVAVSAAMLPILTSARRISRAEGACLLAGYAIYVAVLLVWAPGWFPGR